MACHFVARAVRSAAFLSLIALLFAGFAVTAPDAIAAKAKKSTASSRSYSSIVIDATTGHVIHEDNPDAQRYPASLTKMMTLYLLFDALDTGKVDFTTRLPVSAHAASQSPTKLGLKKGDDIAVRDVVLGLITQSANDAAVVAAEALGGTEDHFGDIMTARARKLGMMDTVYQNASGLPDPNQITTARDIAKLSRALIRDFPHYYSLFSTTEFSFTGRRFANHNHLMSWYDGADGIKTGFINASGFNLAASAVRENRRLVGVVLGGPSASTRDKYMGKLLDDGFHRASALPVTREAALPFGGISGGAGAALLAGLNAPTVVARAPEAKLALALARPAEPAPAPAHHAMSEPPSRAFVRSVPEPVKAEPVRATAEKLPAKTKTIVAESKASAASGWGIQVGAFQKAPAAQMAAEAAAKLAPAQLDDAEIEVSNADRKKKSVYRARLLGISENDAREVCKILSRKHRDCQVLSPADLRNSVRVANRN